MQSDGILNTPHLVPIPESRAENKTQEQALLHLVSCLLMPVPIFPVHYETCGPQGQNVPPCWGNKFKINFFFEQAEHYT